VCVTVAVGIPWAAIAQLDVAGSAKCADSIVVVVFGDQQKPAKGVWSAHCQRQCAAGVYVLSLATMSTPKVSFGYNKKKSFIKKKMKGFFDFFFFFFFFFVFFFFRFDFTNTLNSIHFDCIWCQFTCS
jgi:hypothetical protein